MRHIQIQVVASIAMWPSHFGRSPGTRPQASHTVGFVQIQGTPKSLKIYSALNVQCGMDLDGFYKNYHKYIYITHIIYIYTLHLNTISNVASFFGDTPATEPFDHIGPSLGGQTCCGALHCRPCCGTGGSMDSPGKNGNAWDSPGNCGKSRKLIDIDMQKKTTTVSYWIATWWFPMGFPYLCLFNQG